MGAETTVDLQRNHRERNFAIFFGGGQQDQVNMAIGGKNHQTYLVNCIFEASIRVLKMARS